MSVVVVGMGMMVVTVLVEVVLITMVKMPTKINREKNPSRSRDPAGRFLRSPPSKKTSFGLRYVFETLTFSPQSNFLFIALMFYFDIPIGNIFSALVSAFFGADSFVTGLIGVCSENFAQ